MRIDKVRKWRVFFLACSFFMLFAFIQSEALAEERELLAEVHEYIQKYHVDGEGFEIEAGDSLESMFQRLGDPFTYWLSSEEYIRFMEQINGDYQGIGVRLAQIADRVLITEVFPDSPAEIAGMKRGDWILEINGLLASEIDLEVVQKALTERENQGVLLPVVLKRDGQLIHVDVGQSEVHIPPLRVERLTGGIDYIEIRTFSVEAAEQFSEVVERLKQEEGRGLILDLRNNGGGLLQVIEHFAKPFKRDGALYHLQARNNQRSTFAFEDGGRWNRPIVLLVNRNSASASELFAGFMQDYELAVVVGETTFGKGSVQQLFPLSDDSVLRLTTRRYLTPASHQVDQLGITPDLIVDASIGQTVAALRQLGVEDIEVTWDTGVIDINGAAFPEYFPEVEANGRHYLPSRIVADLLGAKTKWIHEEKAVLLEWEDGEYLRFGLERGQMLLHEGQSLLELSSDVLERAGLHWEDDAKRLTITETGGLLAS